MIKLFEGVMPTLDPKSYIAEGGKVVGKVTMSEYSSIWHNSVLRGDVNSISLGRYSNVQDNSVIHVADEYPTIIGDFVSIGHGCTLHGCIVEDNCLIGIGAIILNGAVIGTGSIVAAGALIKERMIVPPYSTVIGVPGKVVRSSPENFAAIHAQAVKYKTLWTKRYGFLPDADGEEYQGEDII